jgi:hypothetical protein
MSSEDVAVPAGFRVEVPRGTGIGNASAVPALEKRSARGAQSTRGVVRARDQTPELSVKGSEFTRQIRYVRIRLVADQVIEESPAAVGADHRVTMPVGCRPVANVRVQCRAGTVMLVVGALMMIAEFHNRHEPVPVQHGHVVVKVGRRVPAQQVIVIDADFAGRVVVADVVVVGLRQRHVNQAENQNSDSQVDCPWPESAPI